MRMSHSQAQSPHRGANGTSHARASHSHAPDLESGNEEEATTHGTPDAHSAAPIRIISPGDKPILTGPDRTGPHVRFQSRVRISAGVGRRFRLSDGLSSNASSISGSPSSSISAPLRTHYTGNSDWGPLGSRVGHSASRHGCEDAIDVRGKNSSSGNGNARRRYPRSSWTLLDGDADEHTHLLTYATRHSYVGNQYGHDNYHDDAERARWWRERLVDEAFGKWPGRLLNRHWWWWHLEPILCCFCEPDEE